MAVRVVAQGLRLQLRVKPGASRARQCVSTVTDEHVELCVAAAARDGEANKAVVRLLSEILGERGSTYGRGTAYGRGIATGGGSRTDGRS